MSDFMDFLNQDAEKSSNRENAGEEYQLKYEESVLQLYAQIREWLKTYEDVGRLEIQEARYAPNQSERLTELTLTFNGVHKFRITPNTIHQPLGTLFAANIVYFNKSPIVNKEAKTIRLLHQPKIGWYIDRNHSFGNEQSITKDQFEAVLKEKMTN